MGAPFVGLTPLKISMEFGHWFPFPTQKRNHGHIPRPQATRLHTRRLGGAPGSGLFVPSRRPIPPIDPDPSGADLLFSSYPKKIRVIRRMGSKKWVTHDCPLAQPMTRARLGPPLPPSRPPLRPLPSVFTGFSPSVLFGRGIGNKPKSPIQGVVDLKWYVSS